jgi:SnoaL-like domain
MSATSTTFDLDRFARAAEERDPATQLSMYAPDATVTIVDKISQPSSPRVLRTRQDIEGWLQEMFGRDITHTVKHRVKDDAGVAFTMACRYANGTHVVCATVIALDGEKVKEQTVVQAWDEK